MKCPYCSASNTDQDHRCKRCGRRSSGDAGSPDTFNGQVGRPSPGRPDAMPRFQHAATAAALSFDVAPEATGDHATQPDRETKQRRPVYQPSLFASSRVVSFESFAPESIEPAKRTPRPRQRARKVLPGQQDFSFDAAMHMDSPGYHSPALHSEPAIVCDAPVALPVHRMIAAAFDTSIVIIGVSLFFGVFRLSGGTIMLNQHTLPLLLGVAAVFFVLYKLLWCLADGDTAGMRWAHLRLVDFDGQPPEREQRLYRMASGLLSLLAAGLGLLWALVDEESLTWHDHMSKTFPTPY